MTDIQTPTPALVTPEMFDAIDAILDEAYLCHLGFVQDGQPFVIPTIHARVGDVLRAVLVVSIVLEVFSGILIDAPLPVLDIRGLVKSFGALRATDLTLNEAGAMLDLPTEHLDD